MNTKIYHLLTVKYLGPTNYRGGRVKISSDRFEESKTISYDHLFNSSLEQAVSWCENVGAFNVVGTAEGKGPLSYIITDSFHGVKHTWGEQER